MNEHYPTTKLIIWNSNWIWTKRIFIGAILSIIPLGLLYLIVSSYFYGSQIIPSKIFGATVPALILLCYIFILGKDFVKTFKPRILSANNLNFENIRQDI